MKKRQIENGLFWISVILFFISAAAVFLLPFSGEETGMSLMKILVGVLFWFGLLSGNITFFVLWAMIRKNGHYKKIKQKKRPGYLSFFSNRYAGINDTVLIAAIIIVVISVLVPSIPDGLILAGMFFGIYSFCLHFLLNGRVYKYLLSK